MKKRVPGLRKNQAKRDFLSMGPWEIAFSVLPSLGPADFFFLRIRFPLIMQLMRIPLRRAQLIHKDQLP